MNAATTTTADAAAPARRLVNASAGKRLVARLIDALLLVVVGAVTAVIAGAQGPDGAVAPVVIAGSAVAVLVLLVQWWWEATRGRTVGGVTVGIRTVDAREAAPGWWRVLLRTAIVVVAGIVPVIGPLLVTVSSVWDRDRRRQGWHDKAAGTWVVDASLGRDPLPAGGQDAAPVRRSRRTATATAPASAQASAPVEGRADAVNAPGTPGGAVAGASSASSAMTPAASAAPATASSSAQAPAPSASIAPAPGAVPAAPAPSHVPGSPAASVSEAPAGLDDDLEQTRMTRPRSTAWRLAFDDGSALTLRGEALVGRNPVNTPEEPDVLLVNLPDPGRSISKTHAHLSAHADGVWVTDRRSTNGTAVTPPSGDRAAVEPGVPVLAVDGALVHLGDRTIAVTRT
ncbi:RDD family protein [Tersicoccus sp. Bi-70]|uniref:RDD family protein n=1 Tax=Tersicoccus sp. Bi-70 TaxID=1897634 RepID=UPI000975D29D|nr:RDD family protein [Tersicoccus sp. Bi-70]OMH31317.1 hypothetical protein BGP79_09840 [Tersicoccus sp. Bi-70]